jgi:hypothetical protein
MGKRIPKVVQPGRLVRVAIWSELESILKHQDRLVEVAEITKLLKATQKRVPKVVQPPRLVRVAIWGELDSILIHQERLVDVSEITKPSKATEK